MDRQHYTTSQFAQKAAGTVQTLRFYDKSTSRLPSHHMLYSTPTEKYNRPQKSNDGKSKRVSNTQGERVTDCKPFCATTRRSSPQSWLLNPLFDKDQVGSPGSSPLLDKLSGLWPIPLLILDYEQILGICATFKIGGTTETDNFVLLAIVGFLIFGEVA